MSQPRVLLVALQCAEAFEREGIGYFLGGSLASSMQGEPRSTNDIDFVVDLHPSQVESLARALERDFDIDVESLKEAAARRGSWNIYHLQTLIKVDLFMLRPSPFDQSEFSRRRRMEVTPDGRGLSIKSPEDTVLRKLLWFRQGGEVSTTQWRDIVQVLRVSGGQLDTEYMETWAERLGVAALLARAQGEAS